MIRTSASLAVQFDSIFSPFKAADFEQGLGWINKCGFDGVELILSQPGKVDVDDLRKKLECYELKVATISTGQCVGMEGISMTHPSEKMRILAKNRLIEHIDLSAKIGFPNVTVGLLRGRGEAENIAGQKKVFRDELVKCCEYAAMKKVTINLEPINRYEVALFNSCEDTYEFIENMKHIDNLGILFDTFHANIEDKDAVTLIEKIGKRISHVHFADSNRRLPDEGHIDFSSIICALKKSDYDGYVSIEVLNIPDEEWIIKNSSLSYEKLGLI